MNKIMLGMLLSPGEVWIIVLITAVIAFTIARRSRKK